MNAEEEKVEGKYKTITGESHCKSQYNNIKAFCCNPYTKYLKNYHLLYETTCENDSKTMTLKQDKGCPHMSQTVKDVTDSYTINVFHSL